MSPTARPHTRSHEALEALLRAALREDIGPGDVTSGRLFAPGARVRARIVAKARGVLAGGPLAARTFRAVDPTVRCRLLVAEGRRIRPGQAVLMVDGPARAVFAAERTALNLLAHLSGVATLTRRFVERVRPYRAEILDTRKTLPGLRMVEKYAVRMGGGANHRLGLHDAVLIKTAHLKALAGGATTRRRVIRDAIALVRAERSRLRVEVEVANLRELRMALSAKPDAILLDNLSLAEIRCGVGMRGMSRRPLLEASGGITLENIRAIAATGVDRISIGRLTHSAPSLDLSLDVL